MLFAKPVSAIPGLKKQGAYLVPSKDRPLEKTLDWGEGRWIECKTKPGSRYYDVISYKVHFSDVYFLYRDGEAGRTSLQNCKEALLAQKPASPRPNIPYIKQEKGKLCGLAVLEMLFRFHGISSYDQYAIGRKLVSQFQNQGRYKNSTFVKSGMKDWREYPGTGTYYMREFMKKYTKVRHRQIKSYPRYLEQKVQNAFFYDLKQYSGNGVPVLVHQKWSLKSKSGHYRIVLGVDEAHQKVALMDPRSGKISQSFATFFQLWKSDEPWLSYTFLTYHVDPAKRQLLDRPLQIHF